MSKSGSAEDFPLFPLVVQGESPIDTSLWLWQTRGGNLGYYLLRPGGKVVAVDVPDGAAMSDQLRQQGWQLTAVLLTHAHADHRVGLPELCEETGCELCCGAGVEIGTPRPPRTLRDGQEVDVSGLRVRVLDTSGHSAADLSFHFPDLDLCFCGDTLFAWGCGRMFAGPPARFWQSIARLRALPSATRLCCGHDYADDNLRFLADTFDGHPDYGQPPRVERADCGRGPLLPPRLDAQCRENPFLAADDPALARWLGLPGAAPPEVFARLRELRNRL